jgi:hypothetical protein
MRTSPSVLHTRMESFVILLNLTSLSSNIQAIDKASEQKVAAKFIQGGGKMSTKDLMQKGTIINMHIYVRCI